MSGRIARAYWTSECAGLQCRIIQADEIWTYVGKKEKRIRRDDNPEIVGDQYVFVAMDSETKLIPSFRVGKRTAATAWYFMQDLSARLATRVQLTTDGFPQYLNAVEDAFGASIDYAMLIKTYQEAGERDKRYSPGEIVNALPILTSPSFCTTANERVYITASDCET